MSATELWGLCLVCKGETILAEASDLAGMLTVNGCALFLCDGCEELVEEVIADDFDLVMARRAVDAYASTIGEVDEMPGLFRSIYRSFVDSNREQLARVTAAIVTDLPVDSKEAP